MAVSRILSGPRLSPEPGRPFVLLRAFRAEQPFRSCDYYPEVTLGFRLGIGQATRILLFCLAPHGVFRAPGLAPGAVGSYPAFSPLPSGLRRKAVCFL